MQGIDTQWSHSSLGLFAAGSSLTSSRSCWGWEHSSSEGHCWGSFTIGLLANFESWMSPFHNMTQNNVTKNVTTWPPTSLDGAVHCHWSIIHSVVAAQWADSNWFLKNEAKALDNILKFHELFCYDTLLISLIVRVPSFTHARDSFLLSPLLMTRPYDVSSIMQTILLIQWRVPWPRHLFLVSPILRWSIVAADHFSFILWWRVPRPRHTLRFPSYSYDDTSLRRVTLRLLRWRVPTTRHLVCTCI